jgi:tetratricopeptide (TPR) repeat protein
VRLFISYSHDSAERLDRVWDLSERLRYDGIDCRIDQHEFSPPEGWPRWCRNQVQESQFVLVVCTENYKQRYEGKAPSGEGKGAKWEGFIITLDLYEAEGRNTKFIPVVFSSQDAQHVPLELRAATRYDLSAPEAYEDLFRQLTNQPARKKSPVAGQVRAMPALARKQQFSGPPWNVPIPRNRFFTGREKVLADVEKELRTGGLVALTGMGGVGKTQIAAHYAHEHRDKYIAVLWASAASQATLVSDFAAIAGLMNLPQKDEKDQALAVAAVKRWLEANGGWLLILDNACDLATVHEFIPQAAKRHVLLTTQAQATGDIQAVEVRDMLPEDGALLLLRRAKIIKADAPLTAAPADARETAMSMSAELGGLPLALDQAGAYIEESGCGLAGYLEAYRQRRAELLKKRGGFAPPHPEPVAATFALCLENVARGNPAAADPLRLCAFLQPDAIPEEIFTEGAAELGPNLSAAAADPLRLNEAFAEILKYSLLRRDAEAKTLGVHRLVQVVIQDGFTQREKRQWAECAVRAVNRTFPLVEFANWAQCERLLPQALACASSVETYVFEFREAARLLGAAGYYLHDRARLSDAEPLLQRALTISERVLGPEHPDVATSLNGLALLYRAKGRYAEAEPLYQRALAIFEKVLGPVHPHVAACINNLALLYHDQRRYREAEPLCQRALAIFEKAHGPDHPDVATVLNNLAELYRGEGSYADAEPLHQRALAIREKSLGPDDPSVATSLNNLALVYQQQRKYDQAESLYRRALATNEKALGPEHPNLAGGLTNLASLHRDQGKYDQAEPLYQRAVAVMERALGPDHPRVVTVLESYAVLLREMKRGVEARELEAHAQAIRAAHAKHNPPK